MHKTILAAVLLILSAQVSAETLNVDTKASSVAWTGTKKIGSAHNGTVALKEGKIDVNAKGEITGGMLVVDMTTIANVDLKDDPENQTKLITHLSSADFFDVKNHPTATFKLKSVTKKDGDNYEVKGNFTMIGKTKPISFPAKLKASKEAVDGEATVEIDRTLWGLKYNSGDFFKDLAADRIINNKFKLAIKVAAKK
ncbi:MAG: YceI family protein [Bdellovibrionales bacterium]